MNRRSGVAPRYRAARGDANDGILLRSYPEHVRLVILAGTPVAIGERLPAHNAHNSHGLELLQVGLAFGHVPK